MITKFWGKNFGKLGDFSVELNPLTLLVGPNASGKSTFLRGLRLLALLNRMSLYGEKGPLRLGFRATLEEIVPDPSSNRQVTLGVECQNTKGSGMYEISIGWIRERLKVVHEKAEWKPKVGKPFSFDSDIEEDKIEMDYRGLTASSAVPRNASLSYIFYGRQVLSPDLETRLAMLYELTSCFAPFYVYRFSSSAIARPVTVGTSVSQ